MNTLKYDAATSIASLIFNRLSHGPRFGADMLPGASLGPRTGSGLMHQPLEGLGFFKSGLGTQ